MAVRAGVRGSNATMSNVGGDLVMVNWNLPKSPRYGGGGGGAPYRRRRPPRVILPLEKDKRMGMGMPTTISHGYGGGVQVKVEPEEIVHEGFLL